VIVGLLGSDPGLPPAPGWAEGFDAGRAARIANGLLTVAPRRGPEDPGRRVAAEYAAALLRAAGAEGVEVRPFSARGHTWHSVAGALPGTGPADAAPLLIGAHLDAVPGSPGALDDAGGVAVVLEVARVLASEGHDRRVEVRIWDGEEVGLLGSRHEAETAARAGHDPPAAVLVAEIVGRRDGHLVLHSFPETWLYRAPAPVPAWLARTTLRAAAAAGVEASYGDDLLSYAYQLVVRLCRVPFGADDGPFLARGVPALFLSDFSFSRPYLQYHLASDDRSRLSPGGLQRAGRALLATLAALDAAPELPGWDEAPYLFLGRRALVGPWLLAALVLAGLPLLVRLWTGRAPRKRSLLLLAGYAAAAVSAPVPTAAAFAVPVWAAGWLGVLPWRGVRWLLLASVLPGCYCAAVLLWALAVYGTAMPVVVAGGFRIGALVFAAAWLGLAFGARVSRE